MTKYRRVKLEERGGIVGKECTKCNAWKVLESGFYKTKRGLGGRQAICKSCEAEKAREYYEKKCEWSPKTYEKRDENSPKYKKAKVKIEERDGVTRKRCSKCDDWKVLSEYSKQKRGLGGRRSCCKVCEAKIKREYYEKNADRIIDYSRKYRVAHIEYIAEYKRDWQRNNTDKLSVKAQRRRARKVALPGDFTIDQKLEVLSHFKGGCALTCENSDVHLDHVIPIAVGHGGTTLGNMIPLRSDLNISKNDSNIFEWFNANRERFNLEQSRFDALIEYLADINDITTEEYRDYVYWCHENPHEFNEMEESE